MYVLCTNFGSRCIDFDASENSVLFWMSKAKVGQGSEWWVVYVMYSRALGVI